MKRHLRNLDKLFEEN